MVAGLEQVFGGSYNPGTTQINESREELGQEDFFRLMVAQLNNQDPTKPLDNTEFLGQLAQFSTVSGIDDLNGSFGGLVSSLFASQAMMAAQLIDREVLVDTGNVYSASLVPGESVSGSVLADNLTSGARVVIYDEFGNPVNSLNLGTLEPGAYQFEWDGKAQDGSELDAGNYLIAAEGYVNGAYTSLSMQKYSQVSSVSVDRNNTSVLLHLDNGQDISFSQVSEFR